MQGERVRIRLTAKNEGVIYEDCSGMSLHFNVLLKKGCWTLYLPCTRGESFEVYCMSPAERREVLSRVVGFLRNIKWMGLLPRAYEVKIVEKDKKI